jgi:hypothetical protein
MEFKGIREQWKEWKKVLRIKLMEHGLESVACNRLVRPINVDVANWAWESEINKEKALIERRKEQRQWDIDNEKAFAVIVKHLHPDISRQIEGKDCDGISHLTLVYLEEKYGGELDAEARAAYLRSTATPLSVIDTLEMYISRFEENHKEAGTDMTKGDSLLAHLRVILADNHRTVEALKRIRQNKMNWTDAKKCLIEEDRANPATSYSAKEVSFREEIKINLLNNNNPEQTITRITEDNTNANRRHNNDDFRGRSKSIDRNRDRSRSRDRSKDKQYDSNNSKTKYCNKQTNNDNNNKICFQFRDKGSCQFGDRCKFKHEKIQFKNEKTPIQTICRYWKAGHCNREGSCRFKHHE